MRASVCLVVAVVLSGGVVSAALPAKTGHAAGKPGAQTSPSRIACGAPAAPVRQPLPELTQAVPVGELLWLAVYPLQPHRPTKVIVAAQRGVTDRIVVRGQQCSTGARLRFYYGEGSEFVHDVSVKTLQRSGSLQLVFGPSPDDSVLHSRGGYFNFWSTGKWKISAYVNGVAVAATVLNVQRLR
jgi:hypothetical protein